MGGPHIMKLREPIHQGSEIISEFHVQKPKAKHIRNMPSQPKTGDLLDLAGSLCGQPPSVINELSIEDTIELLEVVSNFIQPGQPTGAKA